MGREGKGSERRPGAARTPARGCRGAPPLTADRLAAREHGLVADATRRQLHDAGVLCRVLRGSERRPRPRRGGRRRSRFRCPHTTPDTYQKTARIESPAPGAGRTLRPKRPALGGGIACSSMGSVAPGEHEVPVCGDGLLVGRVTVAEEPRSCEPIWKSEVLPVPRRRRQARLAPGDGDGPLARSVRRPRGSRRVAAPSPACGPPLRAICRRRYAIALVRVGERRVARAGASRSLPRLLTRSGERWVHWRGSWCEPGGRPRPSAVARPAWRCAALVRSPMGPGCPLLRSLPQRPVS